VENGKKMFERACRSDVCVGMAFEIVISETKTETKAERTEWQVVDKRPYTKEELNDVSEYSKPDKGALKPIYGHPPARQVEVEVNREILKQRVETLDLAKVIQAVNGL
jgi:hypothetical protein